jgi:hypothetical protein
MERLKNLQHEFEDTTRFIAFPLDFAEFYRLKERREIILREAQALALQLNISGPQWFSLAV